MEPEIIKAERKVGEMTMMEAVEILITEVKTLPLTLYPNVSIDIDGPDLLLREAFMTRKERASGEEFFHRLAEVDDESEPLYDLATGWSDTGERFSFIVGIIMGLVIAGKSRDQIKSFLEVYLSRLADEKETEAEAIVSKGELT